MLGSDITTCEHLRNLLGAEFEDRRMAGGAAIIEFQQGGMIETKGKRKREDEDPQGDGEEPKRQARGVPVARGPNPPPSPNRGSPPAPLPAPESHDKDENSLMNIGGIQRKRPSI
jgi:hypothetical protein